MSAVPYGIYVDIGHTVMGDTVDEVLAAWVERFALDVSTPQRFDLELMTRPCFCFADGVTDPHTCTSFHLHDVDYNGQGKGIFLPLLLSYTSVTAIVLMVNGDHWRLIEPHENWIQA